MRQSLHKKLESLSRSFEQNSKVAPSPIEQPSQPMSPKSPTLSMSTAANAAALARTDSYAKNSDHASKCSFPGLVNAEQSNSVIDSVAHDYAAYQPIPTPKADPNGSKYQTLGGDTRLMEDASSRHGSRKSDGEFLDLRSTVIMDMKDDRWDDRHNDSEDRDRLATDLKERLHIKGLDLDNSVDVDQSTRWAPAVVHEVVKPAMHHTREEQIHREIHEHEVYHRIQPVYETEVLPARNFVPNPKGNGLIEVSEDQLPDCTGVNQRWFIGEKETVPASRKPLQQLKEPKIVHERIYESPESFPRTETIIKHPPTLEDTSQYGDPVRILQFPDR